MKRLVVDGYGKFVARKGNQLVVKEGGSIKHRVVAEDLRQVVISGKGGISFDAMQLLGESGVDLVVVNWKGDITTRLSTPLMRTVQTRREQYYAYQDHRGGHLARQFVTAKVKNQYAVLGTLAKSRKETSPETAESLLKRRGEISDQISSLEKEECKARSVGYVRDGLMGVEGLASKSYWQGVKEVIPSEYEFPGRTGRYAKDPMNSMLNYGYALLEGEIWRGVHYAGLDPYGGFLHVDRPGRPSMVLDLMEEFRQQLVDKTVVAMVTKRMVNPSNFRTRGGLCRMDREARRKLLRRVIGRFEKYVRHGGMKRRWTDLILLQARGIAKYLRGEASRYEGFYLRW